MAESIDWNDGVDDTPQRPRSGLWRRLRRTRSTTQAPGAVCRPVTVQGADGEPVHTAVLGDVPMSDESRQALGEIVRAAQRKHVADLRAKREAADDDVRAVAALLDATAEDAQPRNWTAARAMVRARFADRIAEQAARDAKARARMPIQGSGYTPLQLLGVPENDEESNR